jgi:transcription elongation factor Elf1
LNRENKRRSFEKGYYKTHACTETFTCKVCGRLVVPEGAGSRHRNHCPYCLTSLHVDIEPGDRAADCGGHMEPIAVWIRKGGEWAIIHRCKRCGALDSNRVAADDNPMKLMSIAMRPLAMPPFPLDRIEEMTKMMGGEGSLR